MFAETEAVILFFSVSWRTERYLCVLSENWIYLTLSKIRFFSIIDFFFTISENNLEITASVIINNNEQCNLRQKKQSVDFYLSINWSIPDVFKGGQGDTTVQNLFLYDSVLNFLANREKNIFIYIKVLII